MDPVSLHKYVYAGANPVNIDDPSGHGDYTLISLMTSTTIGAYLTSTLVNYAVGKSVSATWITISGGNLNSFRWFEASDLISLVPGAVLVSVVKVPVQMVTRIGGNVVGRAFASGGVQRVVASFSEWFASTGGKLFMRSADRGVIELEKGTADKGFQHLLERHLVAFWNGSRPEVTSFWPSNIGAGEMLELLKEAASKYALSGRPAQDIILENGILARLVVHAGKVTTFFPISGPGVVRASALVEAIH